MINIENVEMLKRAATAAGIDYTYDRPTCINAIRVNGKLWNPFVNMGEAFELASALKMSIEHSRDSVTVRIKETGLEKTLTTDKTDLATLTCRAIVLLANET